MEIEKLLKFIKTEHDRLIKFYNFKENDQLKYPIVLKIMEELGELCEEILSQEKIQRIEKLENKKLKIDEELADVVITTLLLAENMNIDLINGLERKIEKIKSRNYQSEQRDALISEFEKGDTSIRIINKHREINKRGLIV